MDAVSNSGSDLTVSQLFGLSNPTLHDDGTNAPESRGAHAQSQQRHHAERDDPMTASQLYHVRNARDSTGSERDTVVRQEPEVQKQEMKGPEVKEPEMQTAELQEPEKPKPATLEATKPESHKPEVKGSEVQKPEVGERNQRTVSQLYMLRSELDQLSDPGQCDVQSSHGNTNNRPAAEGETLELSAANPKETPESKDGRVNNDSERTMEGSARDTGECCAALQLVGSGRKTREHEVPHRASPGTAERAGDPAGGAPCRDADSLVPGEPSHTRWPQQEVEQVVAMDNGGKLSGSGDGSNSAGQETISGSPRGSAGGVVTDPGVRVIDSSPGALCNSAQGPPGVEARVSCALTQRACASNSTAARARDTCLDRTICSAVEEISSVLNQCEILLQRPTDAQESRDASPTPPGAEKEAGTRQTGSAKDARNARDCEDRTHLSDTCSGDTRDSVAKGNDTDLQLKVALTNCDKILSIDGTCTGSASAVSRTLGGSASTGGATGALSDTRSITGNDEGTRTTTRVGACGARTRTAPCVDACGAHAHEEHSVSVSHIQSSQRGREGRGSEEDLGTDPHRDPEKDMGNVESLHKLTKTFQSGNNACNLVSNSLDLGPRNAEEDSEEGATDAVTSVTSVTQSVISKRSTRGTILPNQENSVFAPSTSPGSNPGSHQPKPQNDCNQNVHPALEGRKVLGQQEDAGKIQGQGRLSRARTQSDSRVCHAHSTADTSRGDSQGQRVHEGQQVQEGQQMQEGQDAQQRKKSSSETSKENDASGIRRDIMRSPKLRSLKVKFRTLSEVYTSLSTASKLATSGG